MPLPEFRWKLEVLGSTYPRVEWHTVCDAEGSTIRFIERRDAEAYLARLLRVQPHAQYRVAPA